MSDLQNLTYCKPELLLFATCIAVLITDLFAKKRSAIILPIITLVGIIGVVLEITSLYGQPEIIIFHSMLAIDYFSLFFKIICAISTGIVILLSYPLMSKDGEYFALLLLGTLGMFIIVSAVDIITMFLGLELLSITSYVLAGYTKDKLAASESALKYVLYGAFSTAFMIYGLSFLYGFTGKTNLYEIHQILTLDHYYPPLLIAIFIFVFVGLGLKIAIIPFHLWCPDIYEGAPTPVTAFFSGGPLAAGLALLIRFLFIIWTEPGGITYEQWVPTGISSWPLLIGILSAVGITIGNLAALNQNNIKRLLAYSTIAQIGYILMGVMVTTGQGLRAVLFYLVIYLLLNFGVFAIIQVFSLNLDSEDIRDYRGIGARAPFLSVALALFLFSLTGIPALSGFIGKVYLFSSLVSEKIYWLVAIGLFNSVISFYGFSRIIKTMFLDETTIKEPLKIPVISLILVLLLLIPTIVLGLYWVPLLEWTDKSIHFLWFPQISGRGF